MRIYYAVRTIPVTAALLASLPAPPPLSCGTLKEMPLIDSHAHLDFYNETPTEREEVLRRAYTAGVHTVLAIGIGDGPATMHQALEIADSTTGEGLPQIFASAGIHPQEAAHADPEALEKLVTLAARERCVAIGEIGLDYYHVENPDIPTQQEAFRDQMEIAAAVGKPIILHCRTSELSSTAAKRRFADSDAAEDLLAMLETHWAPAGHPFILHCFSGTEAHARRALAMGGYLSFAGNLTYPKAATIQQVAASAPADRILVETDSPFLAPVPLRGQQNQPANVMHTAAFLATLRNTTPEAIAEQTTANFHTLFARLP